MDTFDAEILDLWKLLHKHEVRYIMVGGFAVNLIESKKAANRPKDQLDAIELEKIHNFTQKNSP